MNDDALKAMPGFTFPFPRHSFLLFCVFLFSLPLSIDNLKAEPFIPTDDTQVLQQVPVPDGPLMREVRQLRQAWEKNPHNLPVALHLARRYRELGRAQGDPRYYGYAQASLGPWWNLPKPPLEVLLLRGILRQAQHNFTGALADLSEVLTLQPNHAQAWLAQAMIFQVQGKYERAQQSCRPLLHLTSSLVSTTCMASVASLNGRGVESYKFLDKALQQNPQDPPRIRLWAWTVLAEMAIRLGNPESAEQHFRQAMALDRWDTYLYETYSDFLLDEARPEEVRELLQHHTKPDGLLLRLALAERQLNSPKLVDHVKNLQTRFAENRLRDDTPHVALEARFTLKLLNRPKEALVLAKKHWTTQREPPDTRILLEAALLSDDFQAARPAIEWLQSVRLEDVRLQKLIAQFP